MMNNHKRILIVLCIFTAVILSIVSLAFTPYVVRGDSMKGSLNRGDVVIAINRNFAEMIGLYNPDAPGFLRDRIIVINTGNNRMIKRCIGLPGDTLIMDIDQYRDSVYVPRNGIFALGDNYMHSYDSRNEGCWSINDIEAFPIYIYFSFSNGLKWHRMGRIN